MGDPLKYVVILSQFGIEQPIIFPAILGHLEASNRCKVVSAGFVSIRPEGDRLVCNAWGESGTLKVKSRPVDSALIELEMNRPMQY